MLKNDYLLDPFEIAAVAQRQQLLEVRLGMSSHLGQLVKLSTFEELDILDRLQAENNIYWDTLVPIFEWTPSQKLALSSLFLRKQVLPRRTAVLSMAEEIREFNQANFNKNQERIWRRQRDFRGYLGKMVAVVLSLSLMVAVASIFRISRLERRSEEQRRETQHAEYELRRLSQELVRTQEEERKSLSRELHDEVGQKLTALRMELGNLGRLRKTGDGEFQEHLEGSRQLAGEALQVVRDLAMGLRPSMLDDLGLAPALEWQAREFYRRSGVPVTVQIDGNLDPL
jgi:signal transduction histidine kinase